MLKTIALALIVGIGTFAPALAAELAPTEQSPHAEAIRLVMQLRPAEIRNLENAPHRWHDTEERSWQVKRPFGPGIVDSTHYFVVTYSIGGKVVGTWQVNTRTHQVAGAGERLRIE
ncbi:hypothetical protein [Cognatilysobacter lacus]|uniref:Uncharacterized protein n=1 Tax=Cognatilysobacter lacus TaxID=1643323 RepID=A0A5D8YKI0_9GAMM|nr:hypothetical protein [Lysobacter lacus]TZF80714.1 hypothetical protein FW784_13870 [Lysobacter lacus]